MEPNNKDSIPLAAKTTLTELHEAGNLSELANKIPFAVIAPSLWPDSLEPPQYLYSNRSESQDASYSYTIVSRGPSGRYLLVIGEKAHERQESQEVKYRFAPDTVHPSEMAGTRILILASGLEQLQIDKVIHSLGPTPI